MHFLETTAKLIVLRCEQVLEMRGLKSGFEDFDELARIVGEVSREEVQYWADAQENPAEDIYTARYTELLSMMHADNILQTLVDLAIASYLIPQFVDYLEVRFGMKNCIELACRLESEGMIGEEQIIRYAEEVSKFFNIEIKSTQLRYEIVSIDTMLMSYLSGSDEVAVILSDSIELFKPKSEKLNDVFALESMIERGAEWFSDAHASLQLSGSGGRRFLAKNIAKKINKDFIFVDIEAFICSAEGDRKRYVNALKKEALLLNAGICVWNITEKVFPGKASEVRNLAGVMLKLLVRNGIKLILCADSDENIFGRNYDDNLVMKLPGEISYSDRLNLWNGLTACEGLEFDCEVLARTYRLNASDIHDALRQYKNEKADGQKRLSEICQSVALKKGADAVGRVVIPKIRLADVKVNDEIGRQINEVLIGARANRMLMEVWKLSDKYPYGRSVGLLMTGAPGTGKTMTANAIASELGMPLFQVNIADIMDKYIGETEKKLEKAFRFAEVTNSILFFDEADSIFGKRSEVNEARDRYANNEISFLLQRIEAYDGIVLMATNIMGNIDPAFLRRIRYVIHFDNPDANIRRQIWESCVTDALPHGDIDFEYLSEHFTEFNGSTIKNVFLNACASAADMGEQLEMDHIVRAVISEMKKTSSITLQPEVLGRYAYLVR
ncbi:MAG: ATP-binding protein [Lachnospiraceae bacterium]|nr:ATP-binding protein [Lachnospiraceae bacterium]